MIAVPITLREASAFVVAHHRHHKPPRGMLFAIGCALDRDHPIVGVAIIGRPVARMLADGWTAEVTRLATDGSRNACSYLYGAAWRAARAIGYRRLVTYTLPEEGGAACAARAGAASARPAAAPGRVWDARGWIRTPPRASCAGRPSRAPCLDRSRIRRWLEPIGNDHSTSVREPLLDLEQARRCRDRGLEIVLRAARARAGVLNRLRADAAALGE